MKHDYNRSFLASILRTGRAYFLIFIFFVLLACLFGNFWLALIEAVITAAMFCYYIWGNHVREKRITRYLIDLSFRLENATKDSMINFPLPMTILSLTGNLLWYNTRFEDLLGGEMPDLNQPIQSVVPQVQLLKILENKENIKFDIMHKGRKFRVVGSIVGNRSEEETRYTLILYWIDKTKEHLLEKELEDSAMLCCQLYVDNYEELFKNTPPESHAYLTALIEQQVNAWAAELHGVYRKNEKDKFFIVFENRYLQKVVESKFDILENVHKVNVGNTIPVTLSIGIGKGRTPEESEHFSRSAIDMALGRGGDQAVIKDTERMSFFGGKTESFERQNRVKARVVAFALRELMTQADRVIVIGHRNPDADSFGAAVGVAQMALSMEKEVYVLTQNLSGVPLKLLRMLSEKEDYREVFISESTALSLVTEQTLLVICDTHKRGYIESPKLLEAAKSCVVIDHHRKGEDSIENPTLLFHEPYASSASEMVTELLQYTDENKRPDPMIAQALYSGMALDTKFFTLRTGVRTFEAASYLRSSGMDTLAVKKLFRSDLDSCIRKNEMIATTELYNGNCAIAFGTKAIKDASVLTSQVADELLGIEDVAAAFAVCPGEDAVCISARSLGAYNVQVVMEQLGGGGHFGVAGVQLKDATVEEALEQLKQAIDQNK